MKKTIMLVRGAILLVFCFLAVNTTFAQNNQWGKWCYTDYTSDGTFTVPEGCTQIWFEAVGGGGASGFLASTGFGVGMLEGEELNMHEYYKVSGGGGGGAYGRSETITSGLTQGEKFTITVGLGGRNTATSITKKDYVDDCHFPFALHLNNECIHDPSYHTNYKKWWNGPWVSVIGGSFPNYEWGDSRWPFYKNRYFRHGGTSSVKRVEGNSMILEAHGGKTVGANVNEINILAGGLGGDENGAGIYHRRGGNGGNATGNCGWIGYDEGAISSGGGGAAGFPADYTAELNPDHRTESYCDKEDGFGRGGTGQAPFYGYGGEGTSDWAWDADSHNGSMGDAGNNYGGGGGGCKQGLLGWTNGANGADGIVRVHFYIEAPALTVNPTANGANPLNLSEPSNVNLNAGANNLNSGFSTQYQWNPSGKTTNPITEFVSSTTTYYVTVTNICTIATNYDACRVTNSGQVKINVDEINAGSIAANNANWVCTPGDTVVTITSTAPGTPAGGNYTWQYSSNGSSWSPVSDATGAEYTVINTTGYYRRGYAKGSVGPVYTSSVYVTRPSDINPGTIKDNNNGTTTNVCSGGNVSVNLSATTSYPVTWQTSTDGTNWTNYTGSVTPLTINGLTTTTYVRYLAKYSNSANPCYVPSNNYYKLNVWENPVVNNITAPADKCPSLSSYPLTGDVIEGSSSSLTYHWGGDADATVTTNPGRIIPTTPNCNKSYSYSLYVTDGNNCSSNTVTKTNGFTTENPEWNLSTIANVNATNSGTCEFKVPTITELKAAVDAALTSSCGNEVTLISTSITPAPGTVITSTQNVTATATDMCGNTHSVTIPVVVPDAPTVEVAPTTGLDGMFLCPGETTTLIANTAAEDPTYQWYPNSLGTDQTATSIAYSGEDVTVHSYYYTVLVTDKYGCTSTGNFTVYTTPKAYIAAKEYTICSDNAATMSLVSDDKVPAGNSAISSLNFNYNTTYTWTISTPNTNITGATEATTAQANFTTGNLFNATLEMQTIVYTVTPTTTTTTNIDGVEVTNSCDGAPFTVTVNVKPKVTNTGAITDFDDADVIITLWYGACDTLYNVITPTYTNNIPTTDLTVNLSNDVSTENSGPILGRIAPGEYTIVWKLTDECGNEVTYTKKYIVRYPNCGEDDPNYTEPYRVTYDGYTYTTVRIGCECWLKENLRNQVDANGNTIAVAKVYQNDDSHLNPFGRLYTWYSAMGVTEDDNTAVPTTAQGRLGIYTPGICPEGWAIPKDAQFEDMMTYAHNNTREASSKNQAYWLPGAAGIDPNNGFEAVGAGYYDHYADFYYNLLAETHFWTSTPSSTTYKGKCVTFTHICPEMIKEEMMKGNAISVRCVKIEPKPILD